MSRAFMSVLLLFVAVIAGCGEGFMAESVEGRELAVLPTSQVGSDGKVTATLSAASGTTQVLQSNTDSAIKGATLVLPPGTLAVDIAVTIEESFSIVTDDVGASLGLESTEVAAAGPAVLFAPSTHIEATTPFTLAIPLVQGYALQAAGENYVVLYKAIAVTDGKTSYLLGVIPTKDLSIRDGLVSFSTTRFGSFQVAKASAPVLEARSVPTTVPPVEKRADDNPLVGRWKSECRNELRGDGTIHAWMDEVSFSRSTFIHYGMEYNDPTCAGPYSTKVVETGDYIVGDASTAVAGARRGNISLKTRLFTPGTDAVAQHLNEARACGRTDWRKGVERDTALPECAAFFGRDEDRERSSTQSTSGTSTHDNTANQSAPVMPGSGETQPTTTENSPPSSSPSSTPPPGDTPSGDNPPTGTLSLLDDNMDSRGCPREQTGPDIGSPWNFIFLIENDLLRFGSETLCADGAPVGIEEVKHAMKRQ